MLGRTALVRRIESHLSKASPDHVSVVGPAYYGKSVLLEHVADAYKADSKHYLTTVSIDLRHAGIRSDGDFKRRLAEDLKGALRPHRANVAEYLDLEDENIHELLGLVFDDLSSESSRVLVVLDGFDHVLAGADLTRTLWDQLRTLAQKPSLRLVAGSRLPLREVCRTEESRTSDFWEIFNPMPVRVGALDEKDIDAFLEPLSDAGCTLEGSARKEISNWTGGVPLLVCALLARLWNVRGETSTLSKPDIDQAAEAVLDEQRERVGALWDDCAGESQADLAKLAATDVSRADLSESRRRAVEDRGFGRMAGTRLRSACRLMQRYATQQAPAIADLKRLFGSSAGFEANIRSALEMRLGQVATPRTDRLLRDFVNRAVRDLDENPELAVNVVRGIATRALSLVWEAELPSDQTLPADWLHEWKHAGLKNIPDDHGKLPRGYGHQCNILRLLTGTDKVRRQSRYVRKVTCRLIDHLQSVGDFGQHRPDFPETKVTLGFAASIVLAAIALVESLTADLSSSDLSR